MSAKEKYLRRLLTEAEFYMNNIDGDDPVDLVGDAMKAGLGSNPIDLSIAVVQEVKGSEEVKHEDDNVSSFNLILLGNYRRS